VKKIKKFQEKIKKYEMKNEGTPKEK